MPELQKFVPITEIRDVVKADGTVAHMVFGLVTAEVADKEGEICDYADSKPYYESWSQEAYTATMAAGQDPSYGNIRLQHTSEVAGKVVEIQFDDTTKSIFLGSEPISETIWANIKKGFYTGYSQGGKYLYRRCNICATNLGEPGEFNCPKCKKRVQCRYACKPAEVSYVDSPCLGKAHFSYVKADGTKSEVIHARGGTVRAETNQPVTIHIETMGAKSFSGGTVAMAVARYFAKSEPKTKRKAGEDLPASAFLIVGDPDDPKTWHLPVKFSTDAKTKSHLRNALARIGQVKGITEEQRKTAYAKLKRLCIQHDIEVDEDAGKATGGDPMKVQKGMYQVGLFARLLEDVKYLRNSVMYEGECEDDPRDEELADSLNTWLGEGAQILVQLVQEEVSELTTVAKTVNNGEKSMNPETLEFLKAARGSLAGHFAKGAAYHEKMSAHHTTIAEEHQAAHDMHKGMMDDGDDMGKAMKPFHKAMMAHHKCMMAAHDKMGKAHAAHAEHCTKMAAAHESEPPKSMPGTQGTPAKAEQAETAKAAAATAAETVAEKAEKAAEPAAAAAPAPAPAFTLEQIIEGVTKGMGTTISAEVAKAIGELKLPVGVKVVGSELVGRDGTVIKSETPTVPGDIHDTGV